MNSVKPLFRYAGNKRRLLSTYAPFFRRFRPEHCIDYFAGSGTMSLWFHHLYPQAKLYLNEKDRALYDVFAALKDEYEDFCHALEYIEEFIRDDFPGVKGQETLYYLIRHQYNAFDEIGVIPAEELDDFSALFPQEEIEAYYALTDEERYAIEAENPCHFLNLQEDAMSKHACYFFLRTFSFSGVNVRNKQGEYTSSAGIRSPTQPCYKPVVLTAFKAMLDQATLFNTDYRELDILRPKSLHYFDPPYVDKGGNLYTYRFDWEHTEELCSYVQRVSEHSTVFMSNYDHPRLKKLMKGFNWYTFPGVGGMHNKSKKTRAREILFYKIHPSLGG